MVGLGVRIGLVMKIVSLPPVFRVLCGVQICVGVGLRGSVEPAVDSVDEESFGEFASVRHSPGVRFSGFELEIQCLECRVCFQA